MSEVQILPPRPFWGSSPTVETIVLEAMRWRFESSLPHQLYYRKEIFYGTCMVLADSDHFRINDVVILQAVRLYTLWGVTSVVIV